MVSGWKQCSNFQRAPLVRQGPQYDKIREHQNDHPETAALLRWGNDTAKQGAITQSGDVCADSRQENPGIRWATEYLSQKPERRPRRFSIHQRLHRKLPTAVWSCFCFIILTVGPSATKVGKWYRGVLEAAERFMARWHVEE